MGVILPEEEIYRKWSLPHKKYWKYFDFVFAIFQIGLLKLKLPSKFLMCFIWACLNTIGMRSGSSLQYTAIHEDIRNNYINNHEGKIELITAEFDKIVWGLINLLIFLLVVDEEIFKSQFICVLFTIFALFSTISTMFAHQYIKEYVTKQI